MNRFSSNNAAQKPKKFSYENAHLLCDEVQRLERALGVDDEDTYETSQQLIEVFRELVEVTVWGDKHDESGVFDIFLERGVMETFASMVCNNDISPEVKVQVIQCVTILLQNLTRQSSVYFVCSKNYINRMISLEVSPNDEELLANYVSFLKTLCLRLNGDSVQLFFQNRAASPEAASAVSPHRAGGEFPLYLQAVRLLRNSDSMVRTAARQIVITVAQLQDTGVTDFFRIASIDLFDI